MPTMKPAIGIDLGGTKALVTLVNPDGAIRLSRRIELANRLPDPKELADEIAGEIGNVLGEAGLAADGTCGIGVGCAGEIMPGKGVVVFSPNTGWHDVPLGDMLREATGLPATVENDVNAGAFGEWLFGAGKGTRNLVAIFVGTGIGGGFVLGGEIYSGSAGAAAEIGHMIFRPGGETCGCGRRGHFEAYAGGACIAARFREAVKSKRKTSASGRYGGVADMVRATDLFEAAKHGDELSKEIWRDAELALKVLACNLATALDPDMLVLGGGIIDNAPEIFEIIAEYVKTNISKTVSSHLKIARSQLGPNAVAAGAAAIAMKAAEKLGRRHNPS